MIQITNLKKVFGENVILQDINVEIEKGDIYGLVGVSGAGKSTLLRCINGLESKFEGEMLVNGVDVKSLNETELRNFRRKIGMIFQHFSLLERATVFENIAFPMRCWGYSKEEIEKKVAELIDLVELTGKAEFKPRQLSGGQKQRVAIARALTMDPEILLCDEATSALDPNITNSILMLLQKINKQLGITIVVVTHQMEVVKKICNKMAILHHGKLETNGTVEDIFLQEPKALENLIGENITSSLDSNGSNIRILIRKEEDKHILSKISKETNIPYSVIWGQLDKYRDQIMGSFVINISLENKHNLISYLDKLNVEYKEVN